MAKKTLQQKLLHVRRCHICGEVNEKKNDVVERCQQCNKVLAPFMFCESTYENETIELSQKVYTSERPNYKVIYPPLVGIALYW